MLSSSTTLSQRELDAAIVRGAPIVAPDDRVVDAIAAMGAPSSPWPACHLSCALVVVEERVVGIFTGQDVVRLVAQQQPLDCLVVRQIMTSPVITLRRAALTNGWVALDLLQRHHLDYLPVVDDRDRLVGVITHQSLQPLLQFQTQRRIAALETTVARLEAEKAALQESRNLEHEQQMVAQQVAWELAQSRQKYYALIQSVNGVVWEYDLETNQFTFVSDKAEELLGYPIETWLTEPCFWQNHVYADDLVETERQFDQAIANRCSCEMEYRMVAADGRLVWVYDVSTLSFNLQGHLTTFSGVLIDISERAQLNAERKRLEQSQQRLIAILEATTDYIGISDARGRVLWNNAALKRLCGLKHDASGRQCAYADYHPQWVVDLLLHQAIPTAIATGSWLGETAVLDATGREIPVSQLILVHRSPQGEMEFLSTIMRDIRVQKEYEQRLERTNAELARATRLKDEFLANMSHELRTPLNAILGMTEGLQDQVLGDINQQQLKALQTIERSSQHLLELINDVLDVAKIESGRIELDCAPTTVVALCQSSLTFVKQQAQQKRIQLITQLAPDLPALLVDERRVRQVLINLLNNAVKFTPEGGRIILQVDPPLQTGNPATSPPPELAITVIDTGIGIAPEHIPTLFQPFVQIDSALNRKYAGTGLGLALVKRLVELHGGRVELTSQVGVGSRFTIVLPCATSAVPLAKLPPPVINQEPIPPSSGSPPLILLAEDNNANITTVSSYLRTQGYRLQVARNGQEAVALASENRPDLILMDIQMPEMDGLRAMEQMRRDSHLQKVPIIALTALTMSGDRERCLAAGANDYLSKPIKMKQLLAIIQHHLALHKETL